MKRILYFFFFCFIPIALFAQRYVSGQITDAEDKAPVPNVTVFISNTTVGAITDSSGQYRLAIPSGGSYELTVSHVAYQPVVRQIEAGDASVEFNIELQTHLLEEVVVESKVRTRQRDINLFWETVLGEKPSKRRIQVVNPEAVYYFFNANTQKLTVTCRKPLQIINNETGYQIQYILNYFTHDYNTGISDWNQQHNFTELEPANLKQKTGWEKKRQEVYDISLEKFIKSLYNNSLHKDGFVLATLRQDSDPEENGKTTYLGDQANRVFVGNTEGESFRISVLNPDNILSPISADSSRTFVFPRETVLLISYGRPVTNYDLNRIRETQGNEFLATRGLKMNLLRGHSIRIFPDGTFTNSLQTGPVNSSNLITSLKRRLPIDYSQNKLSAAASESETALIPDSISLNFDLQRQLFPQEKLHLHTDRDFYVPGEKIWFKAYLADAATHQHSTQSRYVYVELISPADTLVHRVMVRPEEGMFHGYLPITEIVPEGDYTLRAYTRYMENLGDDYFFKKNIKITPLTQDESSRTAQKEKVNTKTKPKQQDFDVSFFPEGGNLLEGILCKVAFKALNSDGTAAAIAGEIIDENGRTVVSKVESFHAGMGVFSLSPEPNKKYTLKCRDNNGLEKQFKLPLSHADAYALAVGQTLPERIAVEVRKSVNAPDIPCYLLAHCRGTVLHFSVLDNTNKLVVFPEEELPAGVIHLMLLNEQMDPLSERLVFNKNNEDAVMVDLHTDKTSYGRREKVIASISLTDDLDNLLAGNLSVSVTDNADVAINSSTTILSTLLLSSELKGYIDSPAYYLQDDVKSKVALDYLMMTHGWRRYNVPEVIKGNPGNPKIPHQTSQELSGGVIGLFRRPVTDSEVIYLTEEDKGFGLTTTDEKGRFVLQGFEYPDSTSYFIQALSKKGSQQVKLTLDDELFPPLIHAPQNLIQVMPVSREETTSDAAPNTFLIKAEQRSQYDEDMRIIHLSEIEVTGTIIKKEPRLEFWMNSSADRTVRREEIERWHPVSVSNILTRIPGVQVYPDGTIFLTGMRGVPIVLIDGMIIDWPEELIRPSDSPVESINVGLIESIDVIKGPAATVFGARGDGGAISITTRRGGGSSGFNENTSVLTPLGFQKPIAFYSPKYDTPEAKYLTLPDFRTTIFWKPDVVISDEYETADIEFYTSDFPTTYSVVIEGLTTEGKIVRQVKEIVVE